jgi:16S rRNA (uracil1498-N3)-methyltransferase
LTSNQFYYPRIDGQTSRVVLEGAEHHHLAKVVRVGAGETVWLFDAGGNRYRARVEAVEKDRAVLRLLERAAPEEPRLEVVLAQALLPAKKIELILQKAAELGISVFIPLETVRSLKSPEDRSGRKTERWARIAREATKQSKGAAAPGVSSPRRLRDILEEPGEGLRIFLSEHGGKPLRILLLEAGEGGKPMPSAVTVFVGPEGGWTDAEEKNFRAAGCEAISLGRRVLKSETAALAAVAMISHFWKE